MPISEVCMDGIKANGHRWKHTIRLGQWPALLGKLNDREGDVLESEVEPIAEKIVAIVRAYVERHTWAKETDLARRADELEMVADCGLEEVNFAMNELYDSFDYWRILVQSPRLPTAQAIEVAKPSRREAGSTRKGESAVPQGCAQTPPPSEDQP